MRRLVVAARKVAFATLDLDDARAGVGQPRGTIRRRHRLFERHHQQAIEMADLAESRAESQEVKDLATDIEAAQGPEIETLTGWLESWGEDVPDEGMSGMDHGDMSSDDMGGMMTEDEMADLESASGAEFDQMFLTMMIEHHEGAIEMAKTEQSEGEFPEAVDMAKEIETTQAEEIQTMQDLLKS